MTWLVDEQQQQQQQQQQHFARTPSPQLDAAQAPRCAASDVMQVMNDRSSSSASLDTTQMRERQEGRGERGRVQMALLRLLRNARVV